MFRRRKRAHSDFSAEIQAHLAIEAERLRAAGVPPEAAMADARRAFGNRMLAEERFYEKRRSLWLDNLWQDLRYGARTLSRAPGFTSIAVLTLALAIGATTAIFSVVNAVLLNPLPFKHANRLVWAWGQFEGNGGKGAVSPPDFVDFRAENKSFEHLGAFSPFGSIQNWRFKDHVDLLQGAMTNTGFFEALGVKPLLGRVFHPADEQFQQPHSVILSYRFWKQAYGGDPAILGKQARVNGSSMTIVGIAPPSFAYPRWADFWFPAPMLNPGMQRRVSHFLRPIGLLKPGVSVARAQADVDRIAARLALLYPDSNKGQSLLLRPLQEVMVGNSRPVILILFGAAVFVLLIACVNIANLLLARNTARQRELATRIAVGAGRRRLLHQLLVENFLLASLAMPPALLLAHFAIVSFRTLGPQTMPRLDEVRLDWHVLLFAAALLLLTTVVFGLLPGWLATQSAPNRALVESARTGLSRRRKLFGSILIVSQTALALCLLIAAGLLIESFWKISHAPPGFNPQHVLTSSILLPSDTYKDPAARNAFLSGITEQVRKLPGLEAVGGISEMPMNDEPNDTFFSAPGQPQTPSYQKNDAQFRMITPGYFQVMRIALLRGRSFIESDQPLSQRVMVVDALFAARYFPHENALGKHLLIYEGKPKFVDREIVGIVAPIRTFTLQQPPEPIMYFPFAQSAAADMHFMLRAEGNLSSLIEPIRRIVTARDPDIAISDFRTMSQVVSQSASSDRFTVVLLSAFAGLALALAMAGVYGVFNYIVVQQTHDFGVRMALGARPNQMLTLVLGRAFRLAVCGVILGLISAWFLMQVLANQLYQVEPHAPAIYLGTALLLTTVAVAACLLPARRAAGLDPMIALRQD